MDDLKKALEKIVVDRDFSAKAARNLESVVARFSEDPRFEDLEHMLASYRPGGGEFLFDASALERECRRVLNFL